MLPFYEESGVPLSKVTGLDLSEGMLSLARKRHPTAEFVQGDISTFEDPNCRLFDRVIFNGCYQNLHDQELALRHVTEELITGGGLSIISEPRGKGSVEKDKKEHPRANLHGLPSKGKLEKIVKGLGGSGTA